MSYSFWLHGAFIHPSIPMSISFYFGIFIIVAVGIALYPFMLAGTMKDNKHVLQMNWRFWGGGLVVGLVCALLLRLYVCKLAPTEYKSTTFSLCLCANRRFLQKCMIPMLILKKSWRIVCFLLYKSEIVICQIFI